MSAEPGEPIVLVDARNVVRSRWPNLEPDRFHDLVVRWAAAEGVRAVAVWDGRAPETALEGLPVVGTGAESADDWIVREAERLAGAGARVRLVSSDRELRERTAPFVETVTGGGAFVALLEAFA